MPRPRFVARRSPIHGTGVFARTGIAKGETVVEYRGRLMTHAAADRKYANTADDGHTFLFIINDRYLIDAAEGGNSARWINHSCQPNCEAVIHEDSDGDPRRDRVFIEAIRAIRPGEELTYDYGIQLEEPHTARMKRLWACRCGSRRCSGTILKPKRGPGYQR